MERIRKRKDFWSKDRVWLCREHDRRFTIPVNYTWIEQMNFRLYPSPDIYNFLRPPLRSVDKDIPVYLRQQVIQETLVRMGKRNVRRTCRTKYSF